jgi:SAM-dependent methyltransferase
LKVADIATGTGIWLMDLAKTLPSTCHFTGYDISAAQFPPQSSWPPNVSFDTHSMLLPFPEPELGTYDIVAIRYVSFAITAAEWKTTIKNLITLLKPGGYLQWIDSDNLRIYQSQPGTSLAAIREVFASVAAYGESRDLRFGMITRTAEIFREEGLVDVSEDVFAGDRIAEDREVKTKNALESMRSILSHIATVPGSEWTKEKYDRLLGEARREVALGAYSVLDQYCVVGRRP